MEQIRKYVVFSPCGTYQEIFYSSESPQTVLEYARINDEPLLHLLKIQSISIRLHEVQP